MQNTVVCIIWVREQEELKCLQSFHIIISVYQILDKIYLKKKVKCDHRRAIWCTIDKPSGIITATVPLRKSIGRGLRSGEMDQFKSKKSSSKSSSIVTNVRRWPQDPYYPFSFFVLHFSEVRKFGIVKQRILTPFHPVTNPLSFFT